VNAAPPCPLPKTAALHLSWRQSLGAGSVKGAFLGLTFCSSFALHRLCKFACLSSSLGTFVAVGHFWHFAVLCVFCVLVRALLIARSPSLTALFPCHQNSLPPSSSSSSPASSSNKHQLRLHQYPPNATRASTTRPARRAAHNCQPHKRARKPPEENRRNRNQKHQAHTREQ
jgi:hypothetical protein